MACNRTSSRVHIKHEAPKKKPRDAVHIEKLSRCGAARKLGERVGVHLTALDFTSRFDIRVQILAISSPGGITRMLGIK